MFYNSVIITVTIVYCSIKQSQTHHSVNCCQSLLTLPLLQNSSLQYLPPTYTICCSIHTVCCKHVPIHCPSTTSDGPIGPANVSGLHQEPLPDRPCLLVWSVDVCSEVTVFTLYVQWPIQHLKPTFLSSCGQQFVFSLRFLLAIWWYVLGYIFFPY